MPSKAGVKVTKKTTKTTAKVSRSGRKRGNPNKCPVCGKFMSGGSNG